MKIHSAFLAPIVAAVFLGVIWIGGTWELPSMQKQFAETAREVRTVNMIVEGLRCRGTSSFFMSVVEQVPGVVSVSTFVQEHRATIKYDPSQTDPERIAGVIGNPVRLNDGRMVKPFNVLEIND